MTGIWLDRKARGVAPGFFIFGLLEEFSLSHALFCRMIDGTGRRRIFLNFNFA